MTGEAPDQIATTAEETEGKDLASDPGAFTNHPRWQRMLIGVAGPVANFILAFVLMFFYYGWINEVPRHEVKTTTVEWVVADSPAAKAGMEAGDVISRFDNINNPDWDQVNQHALLNQNSAIPFNVDRAGQSIPLSLNMPAAAKGQDDFDISDVGILPEFIQGPIGVESVPSGTPAFKAGVQAGDAIVAVDNHPFHTVQSLLAYMESGQGKPISLILLRNGVTLPPVLAYPAKIDTKGYKL